jgi:hypothetical protein
MVDIGVPGEENMRRLSVLLLAVLLLPACGAAPTPTPTPQRSFGPQADAMVTLAIDDLAKRLSVKGADIQVKLVEPMDWPTSALGCPEPGKVYLQVVTPGYKITLVSGGKEHIYHSDRQRTVYCPPK